VAEREDGAWLADLRSAYRSAAPRCPLDEPSNAPTQAAVGWLAASWGHLEPRSVALPFRLRMRARRVQTVLRALVAASILLGLSTLAVFRPGTSTHVPQPPAKSGPRIAAITRELTEIRSGPVRLILFNDRPNRQQP